MHDHTVCGMQALGQQAEVARLEKEVAAAGSAVERLELFEGEVERLESALATEKASASDKRANLEAQVYVYPSWIRWNCRPAYGQPTTSLRHVIHSDRGIRLPSIRSTPSERNLEAKCCQGRERQHSIPQYTKGAVIPFWPRYLLMFI